MTNLRQAAQRALKAMEDGEWRADMVEFSDALIALRAALAEPRPIQECYGDCPTDPATCPNPCRFEGRPKPEKNPFGDDAERYARKLHEEREYYKALFTAPAPRKPEQEPVAWMSEGGDVSRSKRYMDEMGFKCEPLYTAPTPQREHITDGSPCWCNPDVIEEAGGNVIVHNYEDNWQQYAKPGETAQQCIERHRGEQDALMKLYAIPLRPLTDEQCDSILLALDEWAKRFDHYDYGLPLYNEELRVKAREVMRIAHGITGEQHE